MPFKVISTGEEPLTLEEVKSYLRVEGDEDNADLVERIVAAREIAEDVNGHIYGVKGFELSLDAFPDGPLQLKAPLVSVESVSYKDSAGQDHSLTAGIDFIVDTKKEPGIILPTYGKTWPSFTPWPSSSVTVQFTAGYTTDECPESIQQGMLLLISAWNEGRIPFEVGHIVNELPYAVTALFTHNQLPRF